MYLFIYIDILDIYLVIFYLYIYLQIIYINTVINTSLSKYNDFTLISTKTSVQQHRRKKTPSISTKTSVQQRKRERELKKKSQGYGQSLPEMRRRN